MTDLRMVYQWMDIPEFWEEGIVREYKVTWDMWQKDRNCAVFIKRVKWAAGLIGRELSRAGVLESFEQKFGKLNLGLSSSFTLHLESLSQSPDLLIPS